MNLFESNESMDQLVDSFPLCGFGFYEIDIEVVMIDRIDKLGQGKDIPYLCPLFK